MQNPSPFKTRKYFKQKSTLDALSESQRHELQRWFVEENLSYVKAAGRLLDRFRVKVSSTTLHAYWHRVCAPAILLSEEARNAPAPVVQVVLTICRDNVVIGTASGVLPLIEFPAPGVRPAPAPRSPGPAVAAPSVAE